MLKALIFSTVLVTSSALPILAECGGDVMAPNTVYSCKFINITNDTIKCWYTTSKLKKNEVRQPYHKVGKYTVIDRECLGIIRIIEKDSEYTRVICED